MAITKITKIKTGLNEWAEVEFTGATTAADGVALDFSGADFKTLVVAVNTAQTSGTVTVKAGNGIQGENDIETYTIAAGEYAAIRFDSGAFKNIAGDNKGKVVIIPSAATIEFAVIELA